jgi:hypothetical protein
VTTALSEWASKQLLGSTVPRPREARTANRDAAVAFARDVGGPVVAKASGVAHKSDRGLVRLGLDADSVAACWDSLAAGGDGTVVVAEQVEGDVELIVGGVRDPHFGPVVSVGLGGVTAEVFGDVVFVLSPPEPGELDRAITELRSAPLFDGYRGLPAIDRQALHDIVDAVAGLLERDPSVVEVDCNPVLVAGGRPIVVDALVVRDSPVADGSATTPPRSEQR